MQAIYPYVQLLHVICAIIFLGYIFFDVIIFSRLKGILGDEFDRVKSAISKKAIKIMPLCLLLLFLTGGMMMSTWVGSKAGGYFQTPLQQIFMIKVILAFVIGAGVVINLTHRTLGKQPPKFLRENLHNIAFVFGFVIVILAKVMFMV
ncbi:copper resistance protein CopD [Campylobacter sp. RM9344]|uniref:Copper resistance protein CopD n=1 Tax=Campylobacter californiensis TaxID=1032243 RepID=A0AAW3ZSG8_9BACT|nr:MULTISPECIES: copper resistance protein CopD [unclassified Campylobacter]MBE2984991.1 copper resistance protein CopD [Campylobacter sp. RM6883]MBE2986777.1 copper resistance protein CopD [Campylobacter sp. RM12919]MBE2988429.1 copper resistance protein CopD [Campylobacter sp. RM12920]MBE2995187.1 copper resistance protein CopD [Campylobacter sp. RM6913]MBE3029557.1 copper resistance protein CopD [Campylobacter sp. RM9344]